MNFLPKNCYLIFFFFLFLLFCFWFQIIRVHYPGLRSHPDHQIAIKQMSGFGGVISFEVRREYNLNQSVLLRNSRVFNVNFFFKIDGDLVRTSNFIDALKIPYIAPSLGGCESLVEQPTIISYWSEFFFFCVFLFVCSFLSG